MRALKGQNVPVMGMIALETLGHFSHAPARRITPPTFGLIYPKT
jgi:hypothetical protein